MPTTLAPLPVQRFVDNNGNALVGGQLFTYQAGTNIPAPTYTDSTGAIQNANPVICNARGECNVWLTPNVAYKFILLDSLGNAIWTVDQIVNSQLLTLYGGVDIGSTNTYAINFVANFSTLVDGIIIAWIASNTNTGPSTLVVNGLGAVNIVNQDGSPLQAGEITANQVVQVMFKGGNWLLLAGGFAGGVIAIPGSAAFPSITFQGDKSTGFYWTTAGQLQVAIGGIATGAIATGTAVGTLTGVSGTVNVTCTYATVSNVVVLKVPQVSGTSNSTSFGMTVTSSAPIGPTSAAAQWINCSAMRDNGAALYAQVGTVASGLGNVSFTFYKNGNLTGWTSSGIKGIGDGSGAQPTNMFTYQLT